MKLSLCILLCFFWQIGSGQSYIFKQPAVKVDINLAEMQSGDSTTITAFIADCGEWGGHKERIIIVKKQTLVAYLQRDKPCAVELSPPTESAFKDSINLNEESIHLVSQYFEDFGKIAIGTNVFSNAPTDFWIRNKYKSYYREDPSGRWKGFIKLRDLLFKK